MTINEHPDFLALIKRDGWHYATRLKGTGVVCVIALTEERELVLIEQVRIPLGKAVIELPGGIQGDTYPDEGVFDAARKELLEETGYTSDNLSLFGQPITCSPGLTDETIQIVTALNSVKVGVGGGVGSEEITVHRVPLGELTTWLTQQEELGKIIDSKVFIALAIAIKNND